MQPTAEEAALQVRLTEEKEEQEAARRRSSASEPFQEEPVSVTVEELVKLSHETPWRQTSTSSPWEGHPVVTSETPFSAEIIDMHQETGISVEGGDLPTKKDVEMIKTTAGDMEETRTPPSTPITTTTDVPAGGVTLADLEQLQIERNEYSLTKELVLRDPDRKMKTGWCDCCTVL